MRLNRLHITSRYKNLSDFVIDFSGKEGITLLIGNNGSGKSNLIEAISSVFAGLYDNSFSPPFEYELIYTIDHKRIEVTYKNHSYEIRIDGTNSRLQSNNLPSQLICSYSGEENRLWKEFYEPFYQNYVKALRGASLPNSNLVYINKYYWNIALLTLYFYDLDTFTNIRDFCQQTLGIHGLNQIKFKFDTNRIKEWSKNPNPVTNFIRALNPDRKTEIQIDLTELKNRLSYITNEVDFFRYLSAAYMPKDDKIVTEISLVLDNDLLADSLSEGEKKLLLIKLILEVISDENSLILLDEPDSHVHISRKASIYQMLKEYSNRENIITTHSPTLTHAFDFKHITMLTKKINNDAQVEAKDKQRIVHELTKGIWSYQEQNIFLNSNNDILLVEGKSDETFIKKALKVWQKKSARYRSLKFEYLPCGGAEGVKLMISKFIPKPGQKIIAFFDSDAAGWTGVNTVFGVSAVHNSSNFKYKKNGEIWIAVYPRRRHFTGGANFIVEDYFSKALLNKQILSTFRGIDTVVTQKGIKRALERECNSFPNDEFRFFDVLFDLILEIKSKP